MIAVIDYGVGNLFSLRSSLRRLGLDAAVTADPARIRAADRIILPGVGAFGDAMDKLRAAGLVPVLRQEAAQKPLLGICLGMQLLFDRSFEYGEHPGLGLVPGQVCPLAPDLTGPPLTVPRPGWHPPHPPRAAPRPRAPLALSAPRAPPYPRASSAILPFCRRWPLTPCFSTGTPNIWDALAQ